MRLTELGQPVVPQEKITGYLLSPFHPFGRHKAAFFCRLGFSLDRFEVLLEALQEHAKTHEILEIDETPFGRRYVVEGIMPAPDGRAPMIRSVWFIETSDMIPRLVTACPASRPTHD